MEASEQLRDAINEVIFFWTNPPQDLAERQELSAALATIRGADPGEIAIPGKDSAAWLHAVKCDAIALCSGPRPDEYEVLRRLGDAQNELWAISGSKKTPALTDPVTYAEVAALLGCSVKNVRNRVTAADAPNPAIKTRNRSVWSYAALRPWLLKQWPDCSPRLPESFAEVRQILTA